VKTGIHKALLWITLQAVAVAISSNGQGRVAFNNLDSGQSPVTISSISGTFNPANGPAGAYVGSEYTVSLIWVNGTINSQNQFDGLGPIWAADVVFFGTTGIGPGHGYNGDGSGFFDGNSVTLMNQVSFNVTVQLLAWFNGNGLYSSYAQALGAGQNVGRSNLLPLNATPAPGPPTPLFGLQPFTVGIPEPSSIPLIVIGVLSLIIFRRLKAN